MVEVGMHCTDRAALQERCYVSQGLELLEPMEAERRGYYASEMAQIIVPAMVPRPATDEELDAIIAGPETKRVIQVCRLPRSIAESLFELCEANDFSEFVRNQHAPHTELAPGISGHLMNVRTDAPNQLSVSVDLSTPNRLTGLPSKVGDHMDTRTKLDPILIANMGPGVRWHHFTPEFNRVTAGGPTRADRVRFMKSHPDPSSILTYWIKLEAPTEDGVEVILGAPATEIMHDGTSGDEETTAFFCAISPVDIGAYPSLLTA